MPLQKGSSEETISNNIKELIDAGHSPAQAEAIAYSEAGKDEKESESKREIDINGWTEIKDNPISKVGVFEYSGAQISKQLEPDKIYRVYRPEQELSCIESFKLVPWINEHVMLGNDVDGGLTPAEEKGIEGVIGEEVYFKDGYLLGNLKIFSKNMSNLINDGKIELSIGYRCEYDITSGSFNGVQYDAVQKNIRGNHIALVEEGRSGPDVAVLDHFKFTFDAAELNKMAAEKETKDEEIAKDEGEMSITEIVSLAGKLNAAIEKLKSSGVVDEDIMDEEEKKTEDEEDEEKKEDAKDEEEGKEKKSEDETEDEDEKKEVKDEEKKSSAMDSKIKSLEKRLAMMEKNTVNISDVSKKNELADKLSNVIGVFDHKDKSLDAVARYGVKKLGINCKSGHECSALDGYFAAKSISTAKYSLDSRVGSNDQIDKFLRGEQV